MATAKAIDDIGNGKERHENREKGCALGMDFSFRNLMSLWLETDINTKQQPSNNLQFTVLKKKLSFKNFTLFATENTETQNSDLITTVKHFLCEFRFQEMPEEKGQKHETIE